VKLRREARGHHLYDRSTGIHILLDEIPVEEHSRDFGPELLSIALLNACDLECSFCYAPKTAYRLDPNHVVDVCKQFAALGTLEVAFGGGEPTLYQGLGDLCRRIWSETDLGISITTHGHHLTDRLIDELTGHISVIRVSIDAPEPLYSAIRGRPLSALQQKLPAMSSHIPFGINTVVNSSTLPFLDDLAAIVQQVGAIDWLLLPETSGGSFTLTKMQWEELDRWLVNHWEQMPLRVAAEAVSNLSGPFPFDYEAGEYAHVRADGTLCRSSYAGGGVRLEGQSITTALVQLA
jgi:MoaA/NifB/PqqE/SkfB family radical SAM enzyme